FWNIDSRRRSETEEVTRSQPETPARPAFRYRVAGREKDCYRRRGEEVPVRSVSKPWWQQATALVTVSTGGVITALNFVPGAAATMTSPTSVPLDLLAP